MTPGSYQRYQDLVSRYKNCGKTSCENYDLVQTIVFFFSKTDAWQNLGNCEGFCVCNLSMLESQL